MKLIYLSLCLLTFTVTGYSQQLSVEFDPDHSGNSQSEFPLSHGVLTSGSSSYSFGSGDQRVEIITPITFGISSKGSKIGSVNFNGELIASVYEASGAKLTETEFEFADATDETIRLHMLNSGGFVLRDNVANFTLVDAAGNSGYTFSNSSQSPGGEQPSGFSSSLHGETVVVYNPVIQRNGERGSRASIVPGNGEVESFYQSSSRIISDLSVTPNGLFIKMITTSGNGDKTVHVYDRFANNLFEMDMEIDAAGMSLTQDGQYATVYSSNRVQVYRTTDGERLGSSTSRTSLLHADYFPEDNTVISIGGRVNGGVISSPEVTIVDLERRQLDRSPANGAIAFMNPTDVRIERSGRGEYRILGINRPMIIRAQI